MDNSFISCNSLSSWLREMNDNENRLLESGIWIDNSDCSDLLQMTPLPRKGFLQEKDDKIADSTGKKKEKVSDYNLLKSPIKKLIFDDINKGNQKQAETKTKETEFNKDKAIVSCNCGKTKCINLYCACFLSGGFCNAKCGCVGCLNKKGDNRKSAIPLRSVQPSLLVQAGKPRLVYGV